MKHVRWGMMIAAAALLALPAQAQRDPTRPLTLGSGSVAAKDRQRAGGWPVLFVDGRPHVVVGTRLYGEGQMLGAARIERITETEVWLREGKVLRKVSNYPSVRRTALPPAQP